MFYLWKENHIMCLDDQIINTYIDGELGNPWKSQVEEHISFCPACKKRFDQLSSLSSDIKNAVLTDEDIKPRMDRVLAYIERNHFNKKKRFRFLHKTFAFTSRQLIGVAAAFVVVFIGSWAVFGHSSTDSTILLPDVTQTISAENIVPVRASDINSTSKTLESYSIEDILKALDSRGYEVDIRLKSIQPIMLDSPENSFYVVAETESGFKLMSNGLVFDKNGNVSIVGAELRDEGVFSSAGELIFPLSSLSQIHHQ